MSEDEKFAFGWEIYNIQYPTDDLSQIYIRKYINGKFAAEIDLVNELYYVYMVKNNLSNKINKIFLSLNDAKKFVDNELAECGVKTLEDYFRTII